MRNVRLANVLSNAYRVPRYRMTGGPNWVHEDLYDIEATAGRDLSQAEAMLMLQGLLEDRFKLRVHRERRDGPVFVLKVATGGARLERSKDGACAPVDPRNPAPTTEPRLPGCGNNFMFERGV